MFGFLVAALLFVNLSSATSTPRESLSPDDPDSRKPETRLFPTIRFWDQDTGDAHSTEHDPDAVLKVQWSSESPPPASSESVVLNLKRVNHYFFPSLKEEYVLLEPGTQPGDKLKTPPDYYMALENEPSYSNSK